MNYCFTAPLFASRNLALLAAAMLIPAAGYAKRPEKLSTDLDTRDPAALVDVIVQFNSTPRKVSIRRFGIKEGN